MRTGSKAKLRTIRMSAFKARAVLKLISGKSYEEATEILTFSDRGASDEILKCLQSAASNAEHNENLQAEELFVSECFANEGPTLKRWRPRARGRATRINKRTCHITIVLSRYSPEELFERSQRESLRSAVGAGDRSRRVAASQATEDDVAEDDAAETDAPEAEAVAASDAPDAEPASEDAAPDDAEATSDVDAEATSDVDPSETEADAPADPPSDTDPDPEPDQESKQD